MNARAIDDGEAPVASLEGVMKHESIGHVDVFNGRKGGEGWQQRTGRDLLLRGADRRRRRVTFGRLRLFNPTFVRPIRRRRGLYLWRGLIVDDRRSRRSVPGNIGLAHQESQGSTEDSSHEQPSETDPDLGRSYKTVGPHADGLQQGRFAFAA